MHLFGKLLQGKKKSPRFWRRLGGDKGYENFAGFEIRAIGEWAGGDCFSQFVRGAKDDFRAAFEFTFDRTLDLLRQHSGVLLFRKEDDVATLDIGARALAFQ